MMLDDKTLGSKVRDLRTRKGLTQDALAVRAKLSQSEVSRIEKGHVKGVKGETIAKLADALDIRPDFLARGTTFASLFGQSPL